MWIKTSGSLSENVFQLTTPVSTHMLVVGDASSLVDTGLACCVDRLSEELEKCLGEGQGPDLIFITHAHFDHVGGLPALRERFSGIEVLGSPASAELLRDESYSKSVFEKNKQCAEAMGLEFAVDEAAWTKGCQIDRVIGDGDGVDLGDGVEVKLISSPGHSADSVSYLVSPDAALAAGEAVGWYGGRDLVANCFSDSFAQYVTSLDRLSGLDLKILSFPHSGAITGELISKYFLNVRETADVFREQVKARMDQGELVDEVVAAFLSDWQTQNITPEGPFAEEQTETLREMVKAAAAASASTE